MMLHLNPRLGSALIAVTILVAAPLMLPSTAMAQTSPPASAPAAPATIPAVEARIKSLHGELKITAAEEPQWQAFAEVMRDNAQTTGSLIQQRAAEAKTMTAVDDLHSYAAIIESHAAGVQKLATAFATLYDTMSDAQKKNADVVFRYRPRASQPKKSG
jgi:hypothetical protein